MATVVCRQLGCGHYSVLKSLPPKHYPSVLRADCEEVQSALRECQITEESNRDTDYVTEIMCSGSVRFAEGYEHCSGTVEVKTSQSWTTVCESDFDWQDAEVVCREVGCGPPLTVQRALFGKGVYPSGTKEFRCSGSEARFLDCSPSDRGQQNCTGGSLVGVTCSEREDVRLVEGGSRCAGAVEVSYKGEWMRLRSHAWPNQVGTFLDEAAVVCRQLGCGSPLAATWKNERVPTIYVGCGGRETALRQCTHFVNVFNASHCGVICSELLVHPSVSFSTPIRPSGVLQGPQVFRGHSFTVTCSTEPQHPGGSFHLRVPWTNRTLVQAAVNHSASFVFHTADDSQQGSYSCVYENQVLFGRDRFWLKDRRLSGSFSHNFSSESTIFYITITGNLVVLVKKCLTTRFPDIAPECSF
ncbi:hypothetical protein NFI96_018717 [Prochilodus magdalenae]|nr:hypothetical protein NFI96_018717 [Prochilodus magdalenae]